MHWGTPVADFALATATLPVGRLETQTLPSRVCTSLSPLPLPGLETFVQVLVVNSKLAQ